MERSILIAVAWLDIIICSVLPWLYVILWIGIIAFIIWAVCIITSFVKRRFR